MIKRIYNSVKFRLKKYFPNIDDKLRRSNWYHNFFPHLWEYERLQRNADILCLGSTQAKNAIDFKLIKDVKGFNLAVCPETIYYDFQVLKNYHSYLKKNGTILLVLTPFSFAKDKFRNELGSKTYKNIRYYPILHRALIDNFDINLYNKWVVHPSKITFGAFKYYFRDVVVASWMQIKNNPDTLEQSTQVCQERLGKWMKEFHMTDLNPSNILEETKEAIRWNVELLKEMKTFVEERGYKVIIAIPPYPQEMTSLLPIELVEYLLFEPIRQTGIPFISYYGKKEWLSRDNYYHGFLLNASGRKLFTEEILSEIQF